MEELPLDLLRNILCRLPLSTISAAGKVCSWWRSVIFKDRCFMEQYTRDHPPALFIFFQTESPPIVAFDTESSTWSRNALPAINHQKRDLDIASGASGVLCLTSRTEGALLLNPLTMASHTIPARAHSGGAPSPPQVLLVESDRLLICSELVYNIRTREATPLGPIEEEFSLPLFPTSIHCQPLMYSKYRTKIDNGLISDTLSIYNEQENSWSSVNVDGQMLEYFEIHGVFAFPGQSLNSLILGGFRPTTDMWEIVKLHLAGDNGRWELLCELDFGRDMFNNDVMVSDGRNSLWLVKEEVLIRYDVTTGQWVTFPGHPGLSSPYLCVTPVVLSLLDLISQPSHPSQRRRVGRRNKNRKRKQKSGDNDKVATIAASVEMTNIGH